MSVTFSRRLRYLGLTLALSLGCISAKAHAEAGNVNAIPLNQWTFFTPQVCAFYPWAVANNNTRMTMILYPNGSDPTKYLWTTEPDLIPVLGQTCKLGGGFWAYSSQQFWGILQYPQQ